MNDFTPEEEQAYYERVKWFDSLVKGDQAVFISRWAYNHEDGTRDIHTDMYLVTVTEAVDKLRRFSCDFYTVREVKVKFPGGKNARVVWFSGSPRGDGYEIEPV